ncbi:hypothetical protein LBMAG53_06980 [Planctomycetota bacterium]|nr:hypothetical protein LBMAG53_06980 [Planctomycetota bacterium]
MPTAYLCVPAYPILPERRGQAHQAAQRLAAAAGCTLVESPLLDRAFPGQGAWLPAEDRLADLREAAGHDLMIAARGGYGCLHLLDDLPRLPPVVGFSDLTILHAARWAAGERGGVYGMMPAAAYGPRAMATACALLAGQYAEYGNSASKREILGAVSPVRGDPVSAEVLGEASPSSPGEDRVESPTQAELARQNPAELARQNPAELALGAPRQTQPSPAQSSPAQGEQGLASPRFDVSGVRVLRLGRAAGPAFPACLRVLAGLCGTKFQPDLSGCVLCLEDIDEKPYQIDRDLEQLHRAGVFRGIVGLVFGGFPLAVPPGIPAQSGPTHADIAQRWADRLGVPSVFGLHFGHDCDPLALPVGGWIELTAEASGHWRITVTGQAAAVTTLRVPEAPSIKESSR